MKANNFYLLVPFLAILLLAACNQSSETGKQTADSNNPTQQQATTTNTPYESVLPLIRQILTRCDKVEYLMYDLGITFETNSTEEVMRFYSYILDQPANTANCKPGKFDGSIAFKDPNGDIKLGMEFNILSGCNRVSVRIDDKTHEMPLNDAGLSFFNQILRMRPKAETE